MQLDYKRIDFDTKWILNGSKSIIYRESINSTLSIALDKEHQVNDKGKVVITDSQTSGKGTHGKQWISTPYKDLTFSIILGNNNNFGQKLIDECCLAMVHVLSSYGMKASIKPPNDIYINNKKTKQTKKADRQVMLAHGGNCHWLAPNANVRLITR